MSAGGFFDLVKYKKWNKIRTICGDSLANYLIFLLRVGGGYIFIHRLLMEHFAEMYVEGKGLIRSISGRNSFGSTKSLRVNIRK